MNKTRPHLDPTVDGDYLSMPRYREFLEGAAKELYRARFSFAPLIDMMNRKCSAVQDPIFQKAIGRMMEFEKRLQENPGNAGKLRENPDFEPLLSMLLPSFFINGQLGFITAPFEKAAFVFETPELRALMTGQQWEVKVQSHQLKNASVHNILLAGTGVLNTFYDQSINVHAANGLVLRHLETKIERHFNFNVNLDYTRIVPLKPLKKLKRSQIQQLLNHLDDAELWQKYIPPENFLFEGFVIGYLSDVTKVEILSTFKELMAEDTRRSDHEDDLNYLEILVRSFLEMPDVRLGTLHTAELPWVESTSWCLLRHYDPALMRASFEDREGAYGRLLQQGQPVIVDDLSRQKHLSALEQVLREQGLRSLLLAPVHNAEGDIISIFELGSPEPYRFNQLTLMQFQEPLSLFTIGINRYNQEMDNAIRLTMQQEFTSIHPSVEWKFREVANKYYWERQIDNKQSSLEPIVFKGLYPLYGQADIVGSSHQRNHSIQADMTDNLERLCEVLRACRESVPFHLLDVYLEKAEACRRRLERGEFASSDESLIVDLLTQEAHPLLRELRQRFPELPHRLLSDYFAYLDPELDIVYRHRKDYEDSVSRLNQIISRYLLAEEEKRQKILPHFFEKFETDGVEYNLYLGQSILQHGSFNEFYLKDFRLWQLILMCELTRLVETRGRELPVPLTTAQLVFVYNSPMSIRFQLDEKQFDVDGAYNVRYEILKKRIDKAYIKGTDERLTQAGKVSIVWLQEKDRIEYLEYLTHLVAQGYLEPEIEEHDLEPMQGVEGLKALRCTVKLEAAPK